MGTEKEIKVWVTGKWPKLNPVLFSKIDVNGDKTHATYQFLKTCFPGDINWHFSTKFVVGKDGKPIQRFDKNQTWDDIEKCIQTALEEPYNGDDDEKQNEKDSEVVVESKEDVKDDDEDKDKLKDVIKKEYVFKSIDNEKLKITCLDEEYNDIVFDLDANSKELLEKVDKVIAQGAEEKKDVKIV